MSEEIKEKDDVAEGSLSVRAIAKDIKQMVWPWDIVAAGQSDAAALIVSERYRGNEEVGQ